MSRGAVENSKDGRQSRAGGWGLTSAVSRVFREAVSKTVAPEQRSHQGWEGEGMGYAWLG